MNLVIKVIIINEAISNEEHTFFHSILTVIFVVLTIEVVSFSSLRYTRTLSLRHRGFILMKPFLIMVLRKWQYSDDWIFLTRWTSRMNQFLRIKNQLLSSCFVGQNYHKFRLSCVHLFIACTIDWSMDQCLLITHCEFI